MNTPKQSPRYIAMSVPGRCEDGSDTSWFVFDRKARHAIGDAMDLEAVQNEVRRLNTATVE